MLGFDHHRNAARFKTLIDGYCNLRREIFLGLQTQGERIDQPRELGQTDAIHRP
jgi:hypothetical protein